MSLKPLAPEDLAAARHWLRMLNRDTRERGEGLHIRRAVFDIHAYQRGIGFRARVSGDTGTYDTTISSERRVWRGTCSCPVRSDCKHSVAVLLTAFDYIGSSALPPEEAARKRTQDIHQWREWLRTHAREGEQSAPPPELRVRLTRAALTLEWRKAGATDFTALRDQSFLRFAALHDDDAGPFEEASEQIWRLFDRGYFTTPQLSLTTREGVRALNFLLRTPAFADRVVVHSGVPLRRADEALVWKIEPPASTGGDYLFQLAMPDGSAPPKALAVLDGKPPLYVTEDTIFTAPPLCGLDPKEPIAIPIEALETREGLALIRRTRAPLPPSLRARTSTVALRPVVRCWVEPQPFTERELVCMEVIAESESGIAIEVYGKAGWEPIHDTAGTDLHEHDRAALASVTAFADAFAGKWFAHRAHWHRVVSAKFPEFFTGWLATAPEGLSLRLEGELASFREAAITAQVKLEVADAGIDWFDIRIALDVRDTTLTKKELKALLDARGGYVRLGEKGWRRLAFQLSEEDAAQFADLGLDTRDFTSGPQRLHALQLAGKSAAKRLLPEPAARAIAQRVEDIRTRVAPAVPASLKAELRPYQVAGFHFLAYLSANRFGGILADDMGLGKTVQTLAWLLWLREQPEAAAHPALVVCPKSVTDNWLAESARFAPSLRVAVLRPGANEAAVETARATSDLVVLNYAQLRLLAAPLIAAPWSAVILDEAQAIKNPESQTARAAWDLKSTQRLALSGTPIENKLLDLWSIMAFAMPGVLGPRAQFSKSFDQRGDALARRRLAARVRPFLLRRTKNEVAADLPERIEEDLHCEMEGPQLTLYRAELKRARASLLNITTQAALDELRFNILASLLRLRQICCHPGLIAEKANDAESAKLNALLDLLEPLIEEGHKVLVFSQFVGMLERIERELTAREWRTFKLTGETENRGELVQEFQQSEGAAVFLISLRAGGFGLNLTAASYVVLYDPWWNPAVENQAIDRTHRIGQVNKVIAYRLIVKDSIEEKIRALQTQKRALAADILGEENFTRALSLDDFRFLLEE